MHVLEVDWKWGTAASVWENEDFPEDMGIATDSLNGEKYLSFF